jgi:pimeloyl-ACP methyl ester carboxylesterase
MKTTYFETINNKQVFCILTEPEPSQKKVVIMSHGFRGSSIGPARSFVDFENLLLKEGFSVLRFDQPSGSNSEGDYLDSSFNEWVQTTSYFAQKYLDSGYQVALLGQSMGATTTMIVAGQDEFKDKVSCIILWVPDAKSNTSVDPNQIYEEGGQKYKGSFWTEARDADFFGALDKYNGGIHLVYGEHDKYVSQDLREKTIAKVKGKGQPHIILPGQDHSPWDFDVSQQVYKEEIKFLSQYIK